MSHPIVAAFDGHGVCALRVADAVAHLLDLPLAVATAYQYDPVTVSARASPGPRNERRFAAAEEALDRAAETLHRGDLDRHSLPAEDVVQALCDLAVELDAAAIALGPDLRGGIAHDVARLAHCPVIVGPEDPLLLVTPPARVGVAFDGSVGSRFALTAALRLARASGGRVELIAVCRDERHGDALRDAAQSAAAGVQDVDVECRFPNGNVPAELRLACEELDLLACGSHRRGLRELFLGSVSSALIHDPVCPVLVVPPRVRHHPPAPLGLTTARENA